MVVTKSRAGRHWGWQKGPSITDGTGEGFSLFLEKLSFSMLLSWFEETLPDFVEMLYHSRSVGNWSK